MYKKPSELLDEILTETRNYRCEYLQILIEKYVKTQDEGVDIHIRNFTVTKPTNYLKRIEEKPFGYVSTYECKTAKKSIKYWKKQIILQKRATFRNSVGVKSLTDEYHSTNFEENLKHLSTDKAYRTLLLIQKDNPPLSNEESESILSNETELNDDQHSISFAEENESILPHLSINNIQEHLNFEINNSFGNLLKSNNHKKLDLLIKKFSSVINDRCIDRAPKIISQKLIVHLKGISSSKNKEKTSDIDSAFNVCHSKPFIDYIASKSTPKFRFSDIGMGISNKISQKCTKNGELISNKNVEIPRDSHFKSYASDKSVQAFKLRSKADRMIASNENCQIPGDSAIKSLSCISNNCTVAPKIKSSKNGKTTYDKNCQISSNSNVKSYASNKSTEAPKLRSVERTLVISNENNCQISSDSKSKSLLHASVKSTQAHKLRPRESGKIATNKDYQTSHSFSLRSSSLSSSLGSNLGLSVEIDPLSNKKVPDYKKRCKKNSPLTQNTQSFCKSETYKKYLKDGVKIDDLSLKRASNSKKVSKNKQT